MGTTVWTKVAQAGDAGKAVTVPLDGVAKLTLSVAAYSGVGCRAADLGPHRVGHQPAGALDTGGHGTVGCLGDLLLGRQVEHDHDLDPGRDRHDPVGGLRR